jgi:hypothetical protein
MARNLAKDTFSLRLDKDVMTELKARAKAERTTVGALIRRSIDNGLDTRAVEECLTEIEHRIITTICRSISQLDHHQLQTRRVVDISLAQNEYLLFQLIANNMVKRQDGEDSKIAYRRIHNVFMRWLPGALRANGMVKQMIKQVMAPGFVVDEAPTAPSREIGWDGAQPPSSVRSEINDVRDTNPAKTV